MLNDIFISTSSCKCAIIILISVLEMSIKSIDERRTIMRAIFGHIAALPQKEIKEAVILVSYTDDHSFAFQKITGKDRPSSEKYPFMCSLDDGIKLIDPTNSFLRP